MKHPAVFHHLYAKNGASCQHQQKRMPPTNQQTTPIPCKNAFLPLNHLPMLKRAVSS
ncbi:hypothetical protein B0O99DRAFT_105535 [Bisporella sp. PMI_857]|nr:hypothetical protein B0O99DRAFT_105535 [Bisporella sp. PMI_857]